MAASTLNCTILGIRHRSKQSFHLSSIQTAHQQHPSLPLVLLAQGLCAFNDAVARAQQLPGKGDDGDKNPGNDDGSGQHGGDSGNAGGDSVGPSGKDGDAQPPKSTGNNSPPRKRQRVDSGSNKRQPTEYGRELGDSFGQPFPVSYLFFQGFCVSPHAGRR